jgi:tRNA(Ile)-lysidine synthase
VDEAVARVRGAVARLLESVPAGEVAVAVSGGADSLALATAAEFVGHRAGRRVRGLIVDHGLQVGSAEVAADAARTLTGIGLDQVDVLSVRVNGPGGPEAAARRARYAALANAAAPGGVILLGHTRDDQAETVLLGLGRGSGPRSIAGMRPLDPPWGRPLLEIDRQTTRAACQALGLTPWEDPHNREPRFTRVRLRHEVLPLLEDVLNGGVAGALARTARQLREDLDALDELADELYRQASVDDDLEVKALQKTPASIRRRVIRIWLRQHGVRDTTDAHLRGVDGLIGEWRGQGGVWLPGGLEVGRAHGRLRVTDQRA